MRLLSILWALTLFGCGKEATPPAQHEQSRARSPVSLPADQQSKPVGKMAATKAMLAVPEDKAELQRLLALGYSVHDDHLHPPGVKECPFNMGGSMVQ